MIRALLIAAGAAAAWAGLSPEAALAALTTGVAAAFVAWVAAKEVANED